MDAENVEKLAKKIPNFGGIFRISQLKNLKIISLPVALIILEYDHWISIYIDNNSLEIMDSSGYMGTQSIPKTLRRFLATQLLNKKMTITPRIQSDHSSNCGLYALSFLYYKTYVKRVYVSFVNCLL